MLNSTLNGLQSSFSTECLKLYEFGVEYIESYMPIIGVASYGALRHVLPPTADWQQFNFFPVYFDLYNVWQ